MGLEAGSLDRSVLRANHCAMLEDIEASLSRSVYVISVWVEEHGSVVCHSECAGCVGVGYGCVVVCVWVCRFMCLQVSGRGATCRSFISCLNKQGDDKSQNFITKKMYTATSIAIAAPL